MPFAVRRKIIQRLVPSILRTDLEIAEIGGKRRRFVGRQIFAKRDVAFVVLIKMLATRQSSPRHEFFVVICKRCIGAAFGDQAGPDRAVDDRVAAGLADLCKLPVRDGFFQPDRRADGRLSSP